MTLSPPAPLRRAVEGRSELNSCPLPIRRESGPAERGGVKVSVGHPIVLASIAPTGAPQTQSIPAQTQLEDGVKLLEEGHYPDAVDAFNEFKQTAPQDARPYFYCGTALAQMGRLSAAAAELKEAVRLAPEKPEYRVLQADVACRIKQKAAAASTLALFDKPGFAEQLTPARLKLLADVYFRLSKIQDSLRILELLAERTADDPDLDLYRGEVYHLMGRTNLALESFQRSIRKSTGNSVAHFEIGRIYYQQNDLPAAKEALLEAVRLNGTKGEYLYELGMVCLARGELDEAIKYLTRAEPSGPAFPQIYKALGRAYQQNGDRARADAYRRKFEETTLAERKEDDRHWSAARFVYQGEMQLDQGNSAAAQAMFEQAVEADPSRWDAHAYLAEMLLSSPDWQHAHPHLVAMEKIDPDSVVGNYLMAKYRYNRKDYEGARVYAEKVRVSRPGNSELRSLLGNIYLALGEKEKGLEEYEAAVRLAPDRADFREQLKKLESAKLEATKKAQKE